MKYYHHYFNSKHSNERKQSMAVYDVLDRTAKKLATQYLKIVNTVVPFTPNETLKYYEQNCPDSIKHALNVEEYNEYKKVYTALLYLRTKMYVALSLPIYEFQFTALTPEEKELAIIDKEQIYSVELPSYVTIELDGIVLQSDLT